jgi:RNA-directed DNA polymerase
MKINPIINKVHSRLEDYNRYYYGPYNDIEFRFEQQFFVSKLLSVLKTFDLCLLFKTSPQDIEFIINNPQYEIFQIPKKSGGSRWIQTPEPLLMTMQSRLNFYMQNYYHMLRPRGVHGFVINPNKKEKVCNIADNARIHVQQKQVLNLDLKDFFPSIKSYRIKELFLSDYFKYNEKIATALTLLVTYEGALPIGAPTSPVISNFICLDLDEALLTYCNENSINYSRYADDLTFSSNLPITNKHYADLGSIIERNHFKLNTKKTRLKSNNRKQTVTGLIVNDKVNVDRKIIKMVRAMLHNALQSGVTKAAKRHFKIRNEVNYNSETYFLNRLKGYINFIAQVRGDDDAMVIKFKYHYKMIFQLS